MKADLVLVIHFHQPVGNFDHIYQRVHNRCYKPFLDTLAQFPNIKMSMHLSGCLLEWFESNQPQILETIEKLVKRKQVELIGGGFYEPILPIIPIRDRLGQIDMMRRYIKSHFTVEAKGAWIAERIWEPELISSLADGGIEYIVLDDTHFLYAGLKKEDTYGYYVSEDNGNAIRIFPSDKVLRYAIPFGEPEKPISYMREIAEKKDNVIFTYGDDAEKFGEWPGTHKWVYIDKWLIRFLTALSDNSTWLRTMTLSECAADKPPLGRIYLPTASYEEMLEWALPVDVAIDFERVIDEIKREGKYEQYRPFIKGGFFRNFFAKYDEANQMHKRMLYVSNLLGRCEKGAVSNSELDKKLKEAEQELYKGQCNCAYWHGVFGGLYLYHLRKAVYEHLLKAEKMCMNICEGAGAETFQPQIYDFDIDGFDEVILQNKHIWLCVKPSKGGSIVEFDVRDKFVNLINILTRRKEAYHEKITQKTETQPDEHVSIHEKSKARDDLASKLIYDSYRKSMLVDHFFGKKTTLEDFQRCHYKEEGNFVNSLYGFKVTKGKKETSLSMEKDGVVHGSKVKLRKELILKDTSLSINYAIMNLSKAKKEFHFGTEIAFIMPDADSERYAYIFNGKKNVSLSLSSRGVSEVVKRLDVADSNKDCNIAFDFSKECTLWRFPIKTISQSEKEYEENYQGSIIVPHWRISLDAKKIFNLTIDILLV